MRKISIYCLILLNAILFNYANANARNRVEKPAAPITNEASMKIKSYLPNTMELNKRMSAEGISPNSLGADRGLFMLKVWSEAYNSAGYNYQKTLQFIFNEKGDMKPIAKITEMRGDFIFLGGIILLKDNKEAQDQAVKTGILTQKTFDLIDAYHEKQKQAEEEIIQKEATEGSVK
jgi:hypothetical protein